MEVAEALPPKARFADTVAERIHTFRSRHRLPADEVVAMVLTPDSLTLLRNEMHLGLLAAHDREPTSEAMFMGVPIEVTHSPSLDGWIGTRDGSPGYQAFSFAQGQRLAKLVLRRFYFMSSGEQQEEVARSARIIAKRIA